MPIVYWVFGGGHGGGFSIIFIALTIGLAFFRTRMRGGGGGRGPYGNRRGGPYGGGGGPYGGGGGYGGGPQDIRPRQDTEWHQDIRKPAGGGEAVGEDGSSGALPPVPPPPAAQPSPPDDPSNPSDL